MLYIFGGLPGSGKSTLSLHLARVLPAVHLRVDTIEQALSGGGAPFDGPEGYLVAYAIAADNLRLGHAVIADSVNAVEITRTAWRDVARGQGLPFREIQVVCSDPAEHERRVSSRLADDPRRLQPTWEQVARRRFEPWGEASVVVDTAGHTPAESQEALLKALGL